MNNTELKDLQRRALEVMRKRVDRQEARIQVLLRKLSEQRRRHRALMDTEAELERQVLEAEDGTSEGLESR